MGKMKFCGNCDEPRPMAHKFCLECGEELIFLFDTCQNCNYKLTEEDEIDTFASYCPMCGEQRLEVE